MARGTSNSPNRRSPPKKRPAKSKRAASTAPAKGTRKKTPAREQAKAARKAAKGAGRKASKPAKAPKAARKATANRTNKTAASRTPPAQTQGTDEKRGDDAPRASGRLIVENVNVPGYKRGVDATKYREMHAAMLKVLPRASPGLTQDEMAKAVEAHVGPELQAKAMWWAKTVQLDLEAKKQLVREGTKPLRWHLAS